MLMARNVIILEIGDEDGLMWITDVEQGGYASAHITVFRRRRVPQLDRIISEAVEWAFRAFGLAYMASWIPSFNRPAVGLAQRLGWNYDGLIRGVLRYNGERTDAHVFSLSRDEVLGGRQQEDFA